MGEGEAARPTRLSVCLFCGSSDAADPDFLSCAAAFGRSLATAGVRLVYGGGGIGLMGAAARAAHEAGGEVLGVMPGFLCRREVVYDAVQTIVTPDMHERKRIMFEQSQAFAIFPGGVGTLEEVVELISWKRLGLHAKPIVFLNRMGFWDPFFALMRHTVEAHLSPPWTERMWGAVGEPMEVLPALQAALATGAADAAAPGEIAAKA